MRMILLWRLLFIHSKGKFCLPGNLRGRFLLFPLAISLYRIKMFLLLNIRRVMFPLMPHIKNIFLGHALSVPSAKREPMVAGILSFLLMGLGQAYNGRRRKGYLFFAAHLGLAYLYFGLLDLFHETSSLETGMIQYASHAYIITMIVGVFVWVFNVYDAIGSAKEVNAGQEVAASVPGLSTEIFLRTVFWWFIFVVGAFTAIMFANVFFLLKH